MAGKPVCHRISQDLHSHRRFFALVEVLASFLLSVLRELSALDDALATDAQALVHLVN